MFRAFNDIEMRHKTTFLVSCLDSEEAALIWILLGYGKINISIAFKISYITADATTFSVRAWIAHLHVYLPSPYYREGIKLT